MSGPRGPWRGVELSAMVPSWFGTEVCDCDGAPAGSVCDVFFGEADSRPAWLLVDLGARLALVPAAGARRRHGAIAVRFARADIAASPEIGANGRLRGEPLVRLARHYGVRVDRFSACSGVHERSFERAA
jgi:PRC-barrel domain